MKLQHKLMLSATAIALLCQQNSYSSDEATDERVKSLTAVVGSVPIQIIVIKNRLFDNGNTQKIAQYFAIKADLTLEDFTFFLKVYQECLRCTPKTGQLNKRVFFPGL